MTTAVLYLIFYLRRQKMNAKQGLSITGYYFLLPLFIVFLLLPSIPNSEGKILFGNVAVLYFFLSLLLPKDKEGDLL